jgi:hypothetical protein
MSAIVINTKYVDFISANQQNYSTKGFEGTFFIRSSMDQIGIKEDDEVIVASLIEDDLSFVSEGIITKVKQIDKINPSSQLISQKKEEGLPAPKEYYHHNFKIQITKGLKNNNLLSDLEYSIKSVYRFNKPIIHFQQQFRDLSKQDYDTIVHGWIYTARTTFGKLVNAIPRQNKLEFMLQAMDHFSTVDFIHISLNDGLNFLYDYIDRRILSRGRLLVETNTLIKNHLSNIVPTNEIGFVNPKTEKSDSLSAQAEVFENLFELDAKSDLRHEIKKGISEEIGRASCRERV